jgi:hypothetical protein
MWTSHQVLGVPSCGSHFNYASTLFFSTSLKHFTIHKAILLIEEYINKVDHQQGTLKLAGAYCHMSGVLQRIITGSGLDDWIYCQLLLHSLLITIITAHNR